MKNRCFRSANFVFESDGTLRVWQGKDSIEKHQHMQEILHDLVQEGKGLRPFPGDKSHAKHFFRLAGRVFKAEKQFPFGKKENCFL